jgi:hypothetical protein
LKEFDDDQLMAMNPARGDHQQKGQQWWHRAHAVILPPTRRSYFWTARACYWKWHRRNAKDYDLHPPEV